MADEDLTIAEEAPPPAATTEDATVATKARQQWNALGENLTRGQKVIIGSTAAAVLIGLLGVVGVASHQDWRPLFTRLETNDAAAITAQLDDDRVPYRLERGGTAILVPSGMVDKVRLRMASQGLPKGGSVGFELFDDADPWSGRREHEVRIKRALEGELSRTISMIEGVVSAKVHLALPEESVFVDEDRPPTASVMLNLIRGRTLLGGQIEGIRRLVSAGVERLEVGNVEVVDGQGNLLSRPADPDGRSDALEFKKEIEHKLEEQARKILEPVLGMGHVQVKVSADIDFRRIREKIELLDDEKVVVAHETRSSEKRDPIASGPGGVPGTRASAPEGLQAVGGGLSTERKEEDITYIIPKTLREVETPVGRILRLSVAVVVDGAYKEGPPAEGEDTPSREYVPRTPEDLQRFGALVRKAVGFDERRGDQIEIQNERFQEDLLAAGPPPYWYDLLRSLTPWLVALLIAVMLVVFGVRPLVRFATAPAEADIPMLSPDEAIASLAAGAVVGELPGESPPMVMGEDGLLIPADEADRELLAGLVAGGNDPSKVIREFAAQEPARAAQVLRRWLAKG